MKLLIKIVLALFLTFIAMPTIIGIVDKDIDIAYFYNMEEEEESLSSLSEIKMVHVNDKLITNFLFEISIKQKFIITDEQLNCKYSSSILLPPPEII